MSFRRFTLSIFLFLLHCISIIRDVNTVRILTLECASYPVVTTRSSSSIRRRTNDYISYIHIYIHTYIQSHLYGVLHRQYTSNQRRWRQSLSGQLFGEVISFQVALKTV